MPANSKIRLSARFIILDLVGTLLILAGALDLAGTQLLGQLSQLTAGHGWTLVTLGTLSMVAAATSLVAQILVRRRANDSGLSQDSGIQTTLRRSR